MSIEQIQILLIEENPETAKKYQGFLQEDAQNAESAWVKFDTTLQEDIQAAVSALEDHKYDVILVGENSNEKPIEFELLQTRQAAPHIPIILLCNEAEGSKRESVPKIDPLVMLDKTTITAARLQRTILQTLTGQDEPGISLRKEIKDLEKAPDELGLLLAVAQLGAEAATEDELIDQTTALIGRTLFPDNFGILLLNDAQGILIPHSSYYVAHGNIVHRPVPLSKGVVGYVAQSGLPHRINDVNLEKEYLAIDPRTRSELCVPLIAGDRILGVVNAESIHTDAFSRKEERFLTILASQLATAIEKTRAFAAEQTQRQRAETLERVGLALSSTLELPELLKFICQESLAMYEADATLIWLVQKDSLVCYAAAGAGTEAHIDQEIPLHSDQHLPVQVIQSRKPICIQNIDLSKKDDFTIFSETLPKSILGVPLIKGDQPIGTLLILNTDIARTFPPEDIDFATALGSHAAVAIENARLFEEERRRRQEAESIRQATAGMVSSLELTEVLDQILTHLEKVIPYDSSCIFLVENDRLHSVAGRNHPDPAVVVGRDYPLDEDPLSVEIISSRRCLIIEDVKNDPRFKEWGETGYVRGWLGIPLLSRGRVIGILSLDSRKPGLLTRQRPLLPKLLQATRQWLLNMLVYLKRASGRRSSWSASMKLP